MTEEHSKWLKLNEINVLKKLSYIFLRTANLAVHDWKGFTYNHECAFNELKEVNDDELKEMFKNCRIWHHQISDNPKNTSEDLETIYYWYQDSNDNNSTNNNGSKIVKLPTSRKTAERNHPQQVHTDYFYTFDAENTNRRLETKYITRLNAVDYFRRK